MMTKALSKPSTSVPSSLLGLKSRTIVVPQFGEFLVYLRVSRIDIDKGSSGTHGWQVKTPEGYPIRSKFFSDNAGLARGSKGDPRTSLMAAHEFLAQCLSSPQSLESVGDAPAMGSARVPKQTPKVNFAPWVALKHSSWAKQYLPKGDQFVSSTDLNLAQIVLLISKSKAGEQRAWLIKDRSEEGKKPKLVKLGKLSSVSEEKLIQEISDLL